MAKAGACSTAVIAPEWRGRCPRCSHEAHVSRFDLVSLYLGTQVISDPDQVCGHQAIRLHYASLIDSDTCLYSSEKANLLVWPSGSFLAGEAASNDAVYSFAVLDSLLAACKHTLDIPVSNSSVMLVPTPSVHVMAAWNSDNCCA